MNFELGTEVYIKSLYRNGYIVGYDHKVEAHPDGLGSKVISMYDVKFRDDLNVHHIGFDDSASECVLSYSTGKFYESALEVVPISASKKAINNLTRQIEKDMYSYGGQPLVMEDLKIPDNWVEYHESSIKYQSMAAIEPNLPLEKPWAASQTVDLQYKFVKVIYDSNTGQWTQMPYEEAKTDTLAITSKDIKEHKCECGKEKHGFASHAQWCDLSET